MRIKNIGSAGCTLTYVALAKYLYMNACGCSVWWLNGSSQLLLQATVDALQKYDQILPYRLLSTKLAVKAKFLPHCSSEF